MLFHADDSIAYSAAAFGEDLVSATEALYPVHYYTLSDCKLSVHSKIRDRKDRGVAFLNLRLRYCRNLHTLHTGLK